MVIFFKKKDTLNTRIQRLRKEKGLTQADLASKLNITDKAVSKWESGDGNPDISLLPELAEIFGVTTDYLLTGKEQEEKIVTISRMELCAKKDDVEMAKEFKGSGRTDENNKCLLQYVYQYESCKIFKAFGGQELIGNRGGVQDYDIDEFIYMAIISNALDQIGKEYSLQAHGIKGIENLSSEHYTDKIIKALLTDKRVSKETRESIIVPLDKNPWVAPLDWQLIYGKVLSWLVSNGDDDQINAFLDYIEGLNKLGIGKYEEYRKKTDRGFGFVYSYKQACNLRGMNEGNHPIPVIAVDVKTIESAVGDKKIEMAKKMNSINKEIHAPIFDEHTLGVEEIKASGSAKKDDVNKALVIFDGIVDIDALIKLDDFDFYNSIIHEYPASEFEKAYSAYLKKDYRSVLQFGMKYCRNIVDALRTRDEDKLKTSFDAIVLHEVSFGKNTIYDNDTLKAIFKEGSTKNYSYFIDRKLMHSWNKRPVGDCKSVAEFIEKKYVVYFDSILDNSDPRFFAEAVKGDKSEIDSVLEEIVSKHPDRYEIQKILLDAGAMLHHRWVENPGDDYESRHDEDDVVSTQLLKNQIEVLLKKEK